jgi:hypothetical protein
VVLRALCGKKGKQNIITKVASSIPQNTHRCFFIHHSLFRVGYWIFAFPTSYFFVPSALVPLCLSQTIAFVYADYPFAIFSRFLLRINSQKPIN